MKKNDVIDSLYDDKKCRLYDKMEYMLADDDDFECLTDLPKKSFKKFTRFMQDERINKNNIQETIKNDIKLILYNEKNKPKSNRIT
jgi:hypothetical protein